jgi:hypothetical protein
MVKFAVIVIASLLVGCSPIRGGLESEFVLNPESQLPAWYPNLPEGVEREDVELVLQFWTPFHPFDVDDTVFLVKKGWWTIFESTGRSSEHPEYREWQRQDWTDRYLSRPSFCIVTIDEKTEIISFPVLGPVWEVSSETAVQRAIGIEK